MSPPASEAVAPRVGPSALHRIFRIHEHLAAKRHITAASIAAEFELTPRTIKRDIEWLKSYRHAPIEWDRAARSYRYTAPFDLLTGLRLDADETLAVVLAGRTFAAWGESPLGRALTSALGKVADFAGSAISLPASDLRAALHQPENDDAALDAEHRHFARLLDLVLARRETEILYQKPNTTRPERRRVRPLHLAYLDHRWTLIAEDPARAGWRNFLLGRIRDLGAPGDCFTPPPAEKIRAYLAGSLGRFTGEKIHEVRLRIDAIAAPYVRERPWHAPTLSPESQTLWSDLLLHLVGVHHGHLRPSITDNGLTPIMQTEKHNPLRIVAAERFARLQGQLGRWRLAYLEALLKTADADGSRIILEDEQDGI